MQDVEIVRLYTSQGRRMFPIKKKGKTPAFNGWRTNQHSIQDLKRKARAGYNLGWRLSPYDLVVDVDPRKGGEEGARALERYLSIDLTDTYPTVISGRQDEGRHHYLRLSEPIAVCQGLPEFPGVDFLTDGKYVVIPPSIHPVTDQPYTFDERSPYKEAPPLAPEKLLNKIEKDMNNETYTGRDDNETIPDSELADLLSRLPVEEYNTNDEWFAILAASHSGTCGAGLSEFINWSISDPAYSDHAEIIKARWQSLNDKPNAITVRTLYAEVLKHDPDYNQTNIPGISADDFETYEIEEDEIRTLSIGKLKNKIEKLDADSTSKEIENIITNLVDKPRLDQESILQKIKKKTTRSLPILRKVLRDITKQRKLEKEHIEVTDLPLQLARHAKKKIFKDRIIYAIDDRFWIFADTHWKPMRVEIVEQKILKMTERKLSGNTDIKQSIKNIVGQASGLLRIETAVDEDVFRFAGPLRSIINTRNCELHISDKNKIEATDHDPESYLTHCLDTEYRPNATCDLLDKTLEEIFSIGYTKTQQVKTIKHLWEILGYSIQPDKDLATWVLFHGSGNDGKSTILDTLSALLGPFALQKSISELDIGSNNHALADLPLKLVVIDDDYTARKVLPDGMLKKISETKELTANPKNFASFKFINTAIPFIASNSWPRTVDFSNGMQRRAKVIKFHRRFTDSETDPGRKKDIRETELPGFLNKALEGYIRLRERGNWRVPGACKHAHRQWLLESNQLLQYKSECLKSDEKVDTPLDDIYSHYAVWATDEGISSNRVYRKAGFRKAIEEAGKFVKRKRSGVFVVKDTGFKKRSESR